MYRSLKPFSLLFVPLSLALSGPWQSAIAQGPETAGNAEVARIMREFQGRGDLGDDSQPLPPAETVAKLRVADDLQLQLVSGEPDVVQPIHVSFDDQGRMWVVQYRQYPFPAGLKVVRYDQHLRAVFDRVPDAPPNHTTGADSILVYEDSDGDGTYDQRRKVIDGLNIATSVAVGRGGIWVMNPPYLLFYQDKDRDAIPDAEPVVHLSGFGLEDTHSVANSLMFAPDGWLYGVNGSTTTAEIHVPLGDQTITSFQGQCVWRYQPEQHEFEIFEIDYSIGRSIGLKMTRKYDPLQRVNGQHCAAVTLGQRIIIIDHEFFGKTTSVSFEFHVFEVSKRIRIGQGPVLTPILNAITSLWVIHTASITPVRSGKDLALRIDF